MTKTNSPVYDVVFIHFHMPDTTCLALHGPETITPVFFLNTYAAYFVK